MTNLVIPTRYPDAGAFAPYGRIVMPPETAGERQFYSYALHMRAEASAPVLHVNHVLPQALPITVDMVERHPHAAQCFFPLDVSRYVVMVMPSDQTGAPDPDRALAYLMPGSMGVIYNPGIWHLGATVIDRAGHFVVLMWRGGRLPDDAFRPIRPITLTAPA
jgi:ureidoglycolate lyase